MKRLLTGVMTSMAFAALSFPAATLAEERKGTRHIHVDVKDGNDTVTVPFSLAKIALAMSGKSTVEVELGDDVELEQIRAAWAELKKDGNRGELVAIEEDHESVRISTTKDQVLIEVKDRATGTMKVMVHMPDAVIDALLGGKDAQLDLAAALASLADGYKGSLITVNDGSEHVRIWVD